MDWRALERRAVGAPLPADPPRRRAIERGARVRNGWPLRPLPRERRRMRPEPSPPRPLPPHISIGRPISRARPEHDLSGETLYLLIAGEESRASGAAAGAALKAADLLSGGRDLYLVDLDLQLDHLRARARCADTEGLADAFAFGVSLSALGRQLAPHIRFVPPGIPSGDPTALFEHDGWRQLIEAARRRGGRILVYLPADSDAVAAIASRAGAALLLATPEEERRLRALVPSTLPILGVIAPGEISPLESALTASTGVAGVTGSQVGTPGDPGGARTAGSAAGMVAHTPPDEPGIDSLDSAEEGGMLGHQPRQPIGGLSTAEPDTLGPNPDPPAGGAAGAAGAAEASAPAAGATSAVGASAASAASAPAAADPGAPDPASAAATADPGTAAGEAAERETPVPSHPFATPEPRMQAPTARGRTLVEWLAEEEERLRSMEEAGSLDPGAEDLEAAAVGPHSIDDFAPGALPVGRHPAAAPEDAARAGSGASDASVEALATASETVAGAPAESPVEITEIAPAAPPREDPEAPLRQTTGRPTPPSLPDDQLAARAKGSTRYSVPRTSREREIAVRIAAVLILAYWTYYIAWRWTATLNLDALWFSVPLALAETWGWITAFFLVFTVWRLNHRTPVPAPPGLSVDVFITTYDEPLEIIRRTTISARQIRYPHETFVLDDGRREEVRAMTEELGVGYITREDNEHAKAGNLNNALRFTSGDFILQLDADHAPLPHFLDRLLGFFADDRVAFVQTPQDFYNTDSFTSDVDEKSQRLWEEQKLFFGVIQPGKDSSNSAFFCGSCAVIRRAALDEIGGFSVQSVTEDIETSLLLHARGWKSVYHGESLAYGLAAGSATAFHIQHGRWAQGAMQVIRKFNPLTYPGLTMGQRIGYFYSLSAYVVGLQKLVFYSAPVIFFLTGILPIRALDADFLVRFVPYLVLSIVLVEILSRGLGFTWIAERYQMAKFWTYTRALPTFFTNRRLRFHVTPKGPGRVAFATYAPQLVLMVVTVAAVYWATLAHARGWVDYQVDGWRSLAFQLNFLWATINFILAGYVVRLSLQLRQQRHDHRFLDRFPIHLRPRDRQGRLGERQLALTEDLNSSGVSFRSVSRFEEGTELNITLPLSTSQVTVNGAVVHARPAPEPGVPAFIHGVEFRNVPLDVRDAIELHCAHHAVPFKQMQYRTSAKKPVVAPEEVAREGREPTRNVRLPAWVLLGDGATHEQGNIAFLDELSDGAASLIMNEAVPPGTAVIFEVPGTEIRGQGRTAFSRALETPIGVRFVVGVRLESTHSPPPTH